MSLPSPPEVALAVEAVGVGPLPHSRLYRASCGKAIDCGASVSSSSIRGGVFSRDLIGTTCVTVALNVTLKVDTDNSSGVGGALRDDELDECDRDMVPGRLDRASSIAPLIVCLGSKLCVCCGNGSWV